MNYIIKPRGMDFDFVLQRSSSAYLLTGFDVILYLVYLHEQLFI